MFPSLPLIDPPRRRFLFACAWLLASLPLSGQVTLSGYVRDAQSGEALIGATIYAPQLKKGAYANEYGFYSLTLPAGSHEVQYRFVGFDPDTLRLTLDASRRLDVELQPQVSELAAVEISSRAAGENVEANQLGVNTLSMQEVKKLPVFFGETDILKSIQLLPGVKSAGEGSSGFYVRGGGLDQNLILLDEAPVYNASHLLGFFSVFNGDTIHSTQLYKGNMPASYGGRLSSALDIRMKEGNKKAYEVSGGLGLISSRLTFEGPIVEDKGSFIVSGRRTYADVFLNLSSDESLRNSQLYFYDVNAKANYQIGKQDHLYLSGYFGRDVLGFGDQFGIDWGNATGTLRWNHLFGDKLFLNSSFIYSDYDYQIRFTQANASVASGIRDFNWKEDFSYYASSRLSLKWGINGIYHRFSPGIVSFDSDSAQSAEDLENNARNAIEAAAYFSGDWSVNDRIKVSYGLRYSHFSVLGPGDFYTFDAEGNVLDTLRYGSGERVADYGGFEPRLSATWILGPSHSLKGAYARNRQYVHLLSNSSAGTPTDLWLPSSPQIEPEIADQISLGYFRNFADNAWETSVEVYYKKLYNQIDYRNGANILLNDMVEGQLVFGEGQAYGAEFFVKKTSGKLTGWVGYTLSRTLRQFDEINGGEAFPARQDRIHDLSLVAVYDPTPRWSFSGAWVYRTGDAVTFPSGSYLYEGQVLPLYTERNGYRLPAYHRLDLSATWYYGSSKDNNLNISLYNAYGRKNVYTIDFRTSETDPGSIEAVKTYLFRWVPSITWNFAF